MRYTIPHAGNTRPSKDAMRQQEFWGRKAYERHQDCKRARMASIKREIVARKDIMSITEMVEVIAAGIVNMMPKMLSRGGSDVWRF